MRVWIDQDLCTGDGLCVDHCHEVFTLLEDGAPQVGDDPLPDVGHQVGRDVRPDPFEDVEADDRPQQHRLSRAGAADQPASNPDPHQIVKIIHSAPVA